MGKDGKPQGKTTSYAFFVKHCREEQKRTNPGETLGFAEFSRACATKWKAMSPGNKTPFEGMAAQDKMRWERDMANYVPAPGAPAAKAVKRKAKKDPNAPKRPLSGFFFFCNEERPRVKQSNPSLSVGDMSKELGRIWGTITDKSRYEQLNIRDKQRYEMEMAAYNGKTGVKRMNNSPVKVPQPVINVVEEEEDDEDDDEEDDDEEDEDSEEESD